MALQIEVEFGRMDDFTINDSACRAVTTSVGLSLILREEPNMVSFPHDDDSDGRFDIQFGTGSFQGRKFYGNNVN